MSRLALWHVRAEALPLARRLAADLGARLLPEPHAPAHSAPDATGAPSNREQFAAAFAGADAWVLLMATGIATRFMAGLPRHKATDPAVVVVDEACRFAIPLLGGHEGGANALAYRIAALTGAVPVITTATEALKPLTVGLGCRRGMNAERIDAAVQNALARIGAAPSQIREAATVDIKAREPGLLEWTARHQIPLRVFSSEQLRQRPLTATPSEWVRSNIGLAGVCEPCALLASPRGALVVPKLATAGVTVALVADAAPDPFDAPGLSNFHNLSDLSCAAN